MAFCKWCGKKVTDKMKFCGYCGKVNPNFMKEEKNLSEEQSLSEEDNLNKATSLNGEKKDLEHRDKKIAKEESKLDLYKSEEESQEAKNRRERIQYQKNSDIGINRAELERKNFESKKKEKNKTPLIVGGILGCILIGGIIVYSFYDDVMYLKYKKAIQQTTNIGEKFLNYDKIISYGNFEKAKPQILELIENDIGYLNYLDTMKSIDKEKREEIKRECLVSFAQEKYLEEDYINAKYALDRATKHGYSIDNGFYRKVEAKVENMETSFDKIDEHLMEEWDYSYVENDGFYFYDSDSRYLGRDELRNFTKEELALIRNEIYARHGYEFHQQPFKNYFNSKTWYRKNSYFKGTDNELNEYERANVKLIANLEKGK
ncbi:YARHG domain-containing protein [uncultured Clostridium sp.]|uniref:YARHG domain-containing protein n=1 Tax=uncultured Clostridium sp. TaxID=59620 RepID=UPI00260B53B1|nr:YARHG domain-containing protein [uncultured Clostridium sp.]